MMKRELRLLLLGVAVAISLAMAAPSLGVDTYGVVVDGDSPVAWYRLANAMDETANNHDGTVRGDVVFTGTSPVCDHPTAAVFDGSGDYITVPDDADFNFGLDTDFSIEAWAKTAGGAVRVIANKGDSSSGYWMRFEGDGTIRMLLDYGKSSAYARTTTNYADDQWHHIVGVADRKNEVRLYVDGQLDAVGPDLGRGSVSAPSFDQTIGQLDGGQFVNGWLDEVALYDSALTSTQVSNHYWSGYGYYPGSETSYDQVILPAGPLAYYRMADATDSSGNLHNGTAGSGVTFQQATVIANDAPPPPGGTGSAAFDGTTNAIITVPQDADFDLGTDTDFSIEAWIKLAGTTLSDNAMIWNDGDTNGGYWLRVQTDGTPRFLLDFGNSALDVQGSTSLLDEQWHHLVGVADRDEGLKLYVDGSLADEDSNGGDCSSTLDLTIGKLGSSYMNGPMDEVAIYGHGLTDAEVLEHYNAAGVCIPEPGALALAFVSMLMWLAAGRKR